MWDDCEPALVILLLLNCRVSDCAYDVHGYKSFYARAYLYFYGHFHGCVHDDHDYVHDHHDHDHVHDHDLDDHDRDHHGCKHHQVHESEHAIHVA